MTRPPATGTSAAKAGWRPAIGAAAIRAVALLAILATLTAGLAAGQDAGRGAAPPPRASSASVTYRAPSGVTLTLVFGDSGIGPEVAVGELRFPPNIDSGDHVHGAIEILHVIEGELEHTVEGRTVRLTAGMTGYVRPPDRIRHKTGASGARVFVVWVPGDEAARIAARWRREP